MQNSAGLALKRNQHIKNIRFSLNKFEVLHQNHQLIQEKLSSSSKQGSDSENTVSSENVTQNILECQIVEVFNRKYNILNKIGEGSNGMVHRCSKKSTEQVFAVKVFVVEEEHLKYLMNNFKELSSFDHPNIISYKALYVDMNKHEGWLVMDLIEGVSLDKLPFTEEEELKKIMSQVFSAIRYLHENEFVHRDIKPQNIIYNPKTENIKIIDFGISRQFSKDVSMWSNTGTLFYKAPEMFEGGYREKVDIWAAGILLYKLITGETPFESEYHSQTIDNILNKDLQFSNIFQQYSQQLKDFLEKLLNKDASRRPSAKKCLKSPWFLTGKQKLEEFIEEKQYFSPMKKKQKKIKRKFSDIYNEKNDLNQRTQRHIFDLHCLDSEWEEDV